MPDVSVIIPTFNRLWSLPKAVQSCRGTRCETEIIVVDDGSTDGTWEWLQTQQDVVSVRQDNWGKDWAANAGFELAQGRFIRFLDSDDWILPKSIDAQFALASGDNSDVVVGGYEVFDESEKLMRRQGWVNCDDFVAQQLGECDSSHYSAYLFRRDFIAGIPHRPEFGAVDDRIFIIEVAMANPKVSILSEPTLALRHHFQERLQFQRGLRATVNHFHLLMIYKKALTLLASRGELNQRRAKAAINRLWPLAHWIAYTHLDEGCDVVRWIYELDPEFQPTETGLLGQLYRRLGFRSTEHLLGMRRAILQGLRLR
jgi:glycosyltransferase involved in cell wall biosynthesis